MGREANVRKERVCPYCQAPKLATADELKQHTEVCRIATSVGLVLPGTVERPGGIITP